MACKRSTVAQALLARGIDPQVERDQKRHAAKLAGEYTFKTVFDAWVEHRRKELKEGRQSTLSQILRIFNKDVLPTLGRMSIYDIRRPQLLGVLAAIEKRKAFTALEFKTEILTFGTDVKEQVAGRGRRGVLGTLDGHEGP